MFQTSTLLEYGDKNGTYTARFLAKFAFDDELCVQYSWLGSNTMANFSYNKNLLDLFLTVIRSKDNAFQREDLFDIMQRYLEEVQTRHETER